MEARKKCTLEEPLVSPDTDVVEVEESPEETSPGVPVVGIGASAGGLAALEAFFSAMPADVESGMAFVVVQHLAPNHKSILTDLVRRFTRMPVFEVEDGVEVRPNCAYIIPPNCDMTLSGGALRLLRPAAPRGHRLPVDFFFRSLAQDQRDRAVCIVLSGTGSDGTQGVREIKGSGGMVMAQEPASTQYDGMPRSAIATGLVDYVLPPAEMPAQLISYVDHSLSRMRQLVPATLPVDEDALKKIFALLRARTRHDFSLYKRSTVTRRAERRLAVHQIERIDEYLRFLEQTPAEVEALFKDLLIGVTSFFRDPDAFATLENQVITHLLADRSPHTPIRVWVPGCSTGEEACSIAILLQEGFEKRKQNCSVQVFATDIDRSAIEQARSGLYPASIANDVSPERLARFFFEEEDGSGYRVNKAIRDMVVYSEQNVCQDPPFSKLDLISCRNLLIYLHGALQKRLLTMFHYSLKPGGFLFLGTSETVGDVADLFDALSAKAKLYRRREVPHRAIPWILARSPKVTTQGGAAAQAFAKLPADSAEALRELTEQSMLQHYAAAGALVSEHGEIFYLHGRTGSYLEPAAGEAGMNILKMAREGLRDELTSALHRATTMKEPVQRHGLRIRTNGDFITVNLSVRPVAGAPGTTAQSRFLVVFEDVSTAGPKESNAPLAADAVDGAAATTADVVAEIAGLRQELRARDEYIQVIREQTATTNEELESSNEELQSVNEELQSTNEELETSREELQSVNEELATVNAELQQKVSDLSRANNDMSNFLAGTNIGIVFVDNDLRVMRFTPAATEVMNLIPADVGRPISHIVHNLLGYARLLADVQTVLDTLMPREMEVQNKAGRWYLMRIQPYRTQENVIEGAVLTFTCITDLKTAQSALDESAGLLRRLAVVVHDAQDAVTMQDLEGHVMAWNPGATRIYGWSEEEAMAMNVSERIPEPRRRQEMELVERLSREEILEPYRTERICKDGRIKKVVLTATALVDGSGEVYAVATTERELGKGVGRDRKVRSDGSGRRITLAGRRKDPR